MFIALCTWFIIYYMHYSLSLDFQYFPPDLSVSQSIFYSVFMHPVQLQFASQNLPAVKHSQYILRHLLFLHLQTRCYIDSVFYFKTDSWGSLSISTYFSRVFLPRPRVLRVPPEDTVIPDSILCNVSESCWLL